MYFTVENSKRSLPQREEGGGRLSYLPYSMFVILFFLYVCHTFLKRCNYCIVDNSGGRL